MIPFLAVLALVTATARPAHPTVGTLITVDFPRAVVLDRAASYEIVSQQGSRVVVRTFEPKPFALSGTMGNVRFRNLVVPVQSVLSPTDDLKPAPLRPPVTPPYPREPFLYIGIAAAAALLAWTLAWWRSRVRRPKLEPVIAPDERFRRAVAALPSQPQRWAGLADATRAYLAATRPDVGAELTSSEVIERMQDAVVADILRRGDLEKFSPWGAPAGDFEALARQALTLIPEPVAEEAA